MTQNRTRRVALVTGVGRKNGIGAAICHELAEQGFDLCFTWWGEADRSNPWGDEENFGATFDQELSEIGCRSWGIEADLSNTSTPERLIFEFNEIAGELAVLVNNAAVSEQGSIDDLTAASIDRHLEVNVRGMMLLSHEFVRQFRSGADGRIINLISGQSRGAMATELAYATSKGAVEAFTTSLSAAVMARGITVNAVNPGPTDNGWMSDEIRARLLEQSPSGRLGMPEDAARLVAFLASLEAGWITGQIIHSEGGFLR